MIFPESLSNWRRLFKSTWAITVIAPSCHQVSLLGIRPMQPGAGPWPLRFLTVVDFPTQAAVVLWRRRKPSLTAEPAKVLMLGLPCFQVLLSGSTSSHRENGAAQIGVRTEPGELPHTQFGAQHSHLVKIMNTGRGKALGPNAAVYDSVRTNHHTSCMTM